MNASFSRRSGLPALHLPSMNGGKFNVANATGVAGSRGTDDDTPVDMG
jgi:hypothetical protein